MVFLMWGRWRRRDDGPWGQLEWWGLILPFLEQVELFVPTPMEK